MTTCLRHLPAKSRIVPSIAAEEDASGVWSNVVLGIFHWKNDFCDVKNDASTFRTSQVRKVFLLRPGNIGPSLVPIQKALTVLKPPQECLSSYCIWGG